MFERITDHQARALALLPEQFQKPGFQKLIESWAPEFQAAEDALWQVLDATLDAATGARLGQLAALAGKARAELSDVAQRKVARARIHANRSRGRDADIVAMLERFGVVFSLEDFAPAAVLVTLDAFPGEGLPPRIGALVRRTVAGGIGAQVISPAVAGDTFALAAGEDLVEADAAGFGNTAQSTGGHLAGVYS